MNLTEWARSQGVHVTTAYRWYREGKLPVPARKVGRLILVSPGVPAAGSGERAGLYARVSSHDQKPDLDRQVARLTAWAAQAGLAVVRVEAEVGSGMNGTRPRARRLLADPAVTVIVVEHRDRLGRMNTELAEAALRATRPRPSDSAGSGGSRYSRPGGPPWSSGSSRVTSRQCGAAGGFSRSGRTWPPPG